jgi:ABC-2 type transport system ATP-binding protein
LPMQAQYTPNVQSAGVASLLPADAQTVGEGWRFTVPDGGVEDMLLGLIKAGHGVAGLTMQRPSLHDAFVKIVRASGSEISASEIDAATQEAAV